MSSNKTVSRSVCLTYFAFVLLSAAALALVTCTRLPEVDQPPGTPSAPTGPDTGDVDIASIFSATATDPDSDEVSLRFDWGDGDTSAWTAPVPAGASATAERCWWSSGSFEVRAQAKDASGALSGWSEPAQISVRGTPRFADSVIKTIWLDGYVAGIAASPAGDLVYVAVPGQRAVVVIDTQSDSVIAAIPVGSCPWKIAVGPNGQFVYVSDVEENTLTAIRTADNTVVAVEPVGSEPTDVAVLPDGSRIFVSCSGGDDVYVLDASDYRRLAVVSVGDEPRGIQALPGGEYVAVACYGEDAVEFVGVAASQVIREVPVGSCPWGIKFRPGADELVVSIEGDLAGNSDYGGLSILRMGDFSLADSLLPVAYSWCFYETELCISPDGAYAYARVEGDIATAIAVVNLRRREPVCIIFDPDVLDPGLYGLTCIPDGRLYVANSDECSISVFGFSSGGSKRAARRGPR